MKGPRTTPSGQPRLTTSAMIASIAAEGQATRPAPFGHALVALARTRSDVIGMTADLGKYTDLHIFGQEFPDRYYQMGITSLLRARVDRSWSRKCRKVRSSTSMCRATARNCSTRRPADTMVVHQALDARRHHRLSDTTRLH
jgi:hypothetical protein